MNTDRHDELQLMEENLKDLEQEVRESKSEELDVDYRCMICGKMMDENDAWTACPSCGLLNHDLCWMTNSNSCGRFGCTGTTQIAKIEKVPLVVNTAGMGHWFLQSFYCGMIPAIAFPLLIVMFILFAITGFIALIIDHMGKRIDVIAGEIIFGARNGDNNEETD
jgi:hypothetical protein